MFGGSKQIKLLHQKLHGAKTPKTNERSMVAFNWIMNRFKIPQTLLTLVVVVVPLPSPSKRAVDYI